MAAAQDVMLANLLEEEEWLRRVARGITDDHHLAEDIVQSAYLAAMRSPPRDPARRRAWLRTVVKNFARLSYRESSRRTTRERATARAEAIPSAESLVEENELHGIVAETVAQLAEPYRSTVIEHFYHGRTSNEIAADLGIPANTVRVRIRRAVLQLSNTLDRRCEGRRAIWLMPLLAGFLAPDRLEALAIEASTPAAAGTAGGVHTRGSAPASSNGSGAPSLLKALVPAATLALIAWIVIPNTFGVAPTALDDRALGDPRSAAIGSARSIGESNENPTHSAHTSFGSRFDAVPVDSSSAISPPNATSSFAMIPRLVQVVDRSTGMPISDAEVFVESFSMVSDRLARGRSRLEYLMQPFARTPVGRTDAAGNLEADPARLARDRIAVRAPGYSEFRERERLRLSDESGVLRIELDPAELTAFEVRLPGGSPARRVPVRVIAASGSELTGETDANGRFEFLREEGQYAVAIDLPGFREVRSLALPDTSITLARAPRSIFVVNNARGLPIAEAAVEIRLADRTLIHANTGPRGTFSFHAEAETERAARATVRVSHPEYPTGIFEVAIDRTARSAHPLALADPSWIEGNVRALDQRGVSTAAGGGVVLAIPNSPFYVRDLPSAEIDLNGEFRLGPLAAGNEFSLRIEGVDRTGVPLAPLEIATEDPRSRTTLPYETRKIEVDLEPGLTLEGRVVTPGGDPLPGVRLRLGGVVGDELRGPLVETDREGRFRFVGLTAEAESFRPTLREPRWSALGSMDPPPATGRILQVLTPHQLLSVGEETIPRKFFLGSRNTLSVPDEALSGGTASGAGTPGTALELVVAPWPAERMPRVALRDPDGNPVHDVLNWIIYPPEDPSDLSAIFAGTDGNPVRIGDPTPLEGCWIQFYSENHALTGGWFGLRSNGQNRTENSATGVDESAVWEVTLLPRVEHRLRVRVPLEGNERSAIESDRRSARKQASSGETLPLADTDLWWVPAEEAGLAVSLGRTNAQGELTVDRLPPGRFRLLMRNEIRGAAGVASEKKTSATVAAKSSRPPRPYKDAIAVEDGVTIGVLEIPITNRSSRNDRARANVGGETNLGSGGKTIEVIVDLGDGHSPPPVDRSGSDPRG